MLAGSGVRAVALGPGAYVLVGAPETKRRTTRRADPLPAPARRTVTVAAESEAAPPAELVVTGSKRRILLAAYPGAATIVDGRDLILDGVAGSDALVQHVPSLTSTHLGPGRNKLFVRGIADSSFNGPTQATVGEYLRDTRLNYNAPDPDLRLYDIERIEVLAGPQGTLYGAGSLGGIIRIMPKPPRLDRGEASAAAGASVTQHGAPGAEAAAMLNLPLVDHSLGLRLVGYGESEGGYIDDLGRDLRDVNRTRTIGGRATLRLDRHDWTIDLSLTGQRIRGEDGQFADRDSPPLTRRSRVKQDFTNSYALADLVVSKSWNDLRLVASTGIVRQTLLEHYDSSRANGPALLFEQRNRIAMLSAETRLSRDLSEDRGWVVGASFVTNSSEQERALGNPARPAPITGVRNGVTEASLFGEATIGLASGVSATAGARLTHSRLSGKALDAPLVLQPVLAGLQASRTETMLLPSLALSARATDELTLFGRFQRGFRPGGLAVTGELVRRFRNDRVSTLEGGLRYHGSGPGTLDAAATLAFTRWRDIQADIVDINGMPTTRNVGDGRIWSVDLSVAWRPISGLNLESGASFNWSRVTDSLPAFLIASSSQLPNVARMNARLAADYRAALAEGLGLRFNASARYVGKSRLGIGPILGEAQGDWLDTRVATALETDRQAFTLSVSNLLDEKGNRFALGSPFTLLHRRQITPLRPRTVRLGWEIRF